MLAARQWRKIFLLLRVTAVLIDVIRAKRIVCGYRDADRSIHTRKLFNRCGIFDIAQTGASILLRKQNAQQTESAQLWLQLGGKMLSLIPFHHMRRDLCFSEFAYAHLHLQLLVSKFEFHMSLSVTFLLSSDYPVRRYRSLEFQQTAVSIL